MTVRSTVDFDALAEGAVLANGSTALPSPWTVTATRNATVLGAASIHGAKGLQFAAADTGFWQATFAETAHSNQIVLSGYFTPTALTAITYLATVLNGASNVGNWRINADGTVAIRNATTAVATSAIALNLTGAVTYRYEWMIKSGTTGQELRIYEGDSATPLFTLTGAMSTGTRTGFYFGIGASVTGTALNYDTVRVADDWTGPFTPTPPSGLTIATDRVSVLGDSLTYMGGNGVTYITNALAARGWDSSKVEVSGITGRLIWGGSTHPTTEETIDAWRVDNVDSRNWIVALGANNQSASQSNLQGYYLNLLLKIGPGRHVHFIDQGFQGQSENLWIYNGALAIGARYVKNGTTGVSEVNAAIRNVADLANADPATYPVCTVHNWNDDAGMRAAGSSIWNTPSDTSSIGGTARHMVDAGYLNYRAPFYALAMDSERTIVASNSGFLLYAMG